MVNTGKAEDGVADKEHLPSCLLKFNCMATYMSILHIDKHMCMLSMHMEKHQAGESLTPGFTDFHF